MMKHWLLFAVLVTIFSGCRGPQNPESKPDIVSDDLKFHLSYLASDELEGRGSGTKGDSLAAVHIADAFREYGLTPKGESGYFQRFEITNDVIADSSNVLKSGDAVYQLKSDFIPYSFSSNDTVEAQVVFAGYGIDAPEQKYNDYQNLDIKGKIVLILRNGPDGDDRKSPFSNQTPVRRKAGVAAEKGAAAVLITTGFLDGDDDLPALRYDMTSGDYGIPVFSVKRDIAMKMMNIGAEEFKKLQTQLNKRKPVSPLASQKPVFLQSRIIFKRSTTSNVIGFLEGTDSELKSEIIVVGAHYDHLGWGGVNSTYRGEPAIHNGADDNASGTSSVLEIAQKSASVKSTFKRSVLFIAFAAEEIGLLGSKHFLEHPAIEVKNIAAMINLDMVGRLKENKLIVYGMGTSKNFADMVKEKNKPYSLDLTLRNEGDGPSDVAEFYRKDIPVLYFFTNVHDDYHKPSDDADKINFEGQEKITNMVFDCLAELVNLDKRPEFTKVKGETNIRPMGFRVTLGIVPNMAESGEGLKVDGVNPGGAADKAGIQKGDIIVKFGARVIKNIYDYTYSLGDHKPGDKVDIIVKRSGKEITLKAEMQKSKRRE